MFISHTPNNSNNISTIISINKQLSSEAVLFRPEDGNLLIQTHDVLIQWSGVQEKPLHSLHRVPNSKILK